jgi:hypothetical protein
MGGGGVLIAVGGGFRSFRRRCDLEFFEECVWVENTRINKINSLIKG